MSSFRWYSAKPDFLFEPNRKSGFAYLFIYLFIYSIPHEASHTLQYLHNDHTAILLAE